MESTQSGTRKHTARITREFSSINEFLLTHGINPTRQRLAIATLLYEKDQHLSADVILERVNADISNTSVSKATVYNTLNLFVKNGILQEIAVDPQKTLYDTNTDHHHHIVDLNNGLISDIQPVKIDLSEIDGIQQEQIVSSVDLTIKIQNNTEQVTDPQDQ